MKLLGKIYRYFFWTNLYPVSLTWDAVIRDRMKKHEFEIINQYQARLGDLILWIGNYPYAYLMDESKERNRNLMPTKQTRYEAKKRIDIAFNKYLQDTYPIK